MQNAEVRQDAAGNRVLDRHHAAVGLAALDLSGYLSKRRSRYDLDSFAPVPFGDNVVETSLVTLYGYFHFFVHLPVSFTSPRIDKKSRFLTDRDFLLF